MICYVLLVFSILVSVIGGGEGATAAYNPTDVFLFNCGSTSENVDDNGRNWTVENRKFMLSNLDNASFSSDALHQKSGVPQVPYMKARIFRSDFTYSFQVSSGWKFIRLYFYPTQYNFGFDTVNTFFSVTVNGFTLLQNFSADITVKSSKTESIIKEFIVPVNQTLNLTFMPSLNSLAFVNGIEILSMPDRFYSKGGFDDKIINVDSDVDFEIDNSTAFETVHRRNIGGQMVSDVRDSGMFRRWFPDDEDEIEGVVVSVPNAKINYTDKTPVYVAPEDVYATSRSMGVINNDPRLNLQRNLTWYFTVDAGYTYLVRLHFYETLLEVNGINQRVFSILIGKREAMKEMDVIRLSGGSQNPVYIDFRVFVGSENGMRPDLRLDLHPVTGALFYDAILNGVEILKLNSSDGNLAGTNPDPIMSSDLTPSLILPPVRKGNNSHILVIILIPVGSTIVLATFIVALMLSMRQMKRKKKRKENSIVTFKVPLKQYTYAELKKITKSFSYTLGKGGFGTVYGGSLSDGRKVAVKVLKDSNARGQDFINEVASMSQTSHVNIVSILGFCYEGSKRGIVYEFLENGSLDQFASRNKSLIQDVTTLYGIALGIARGLEYLHYGCKTRIVHFDIKPQNILLDGNLCPKVSDFGLAKLCEERESIVSLIDTRGTIGYIAPELFSRMYGRVSHKSDVYSYGMLVLEMIGAKDKELVEATVSNASSSYFPDWIYKNLENGEETWIFGDEVTKAEKATAKKMVVVGLWCIQPCPSNRPPMNRVVEMMEGSLEALEVPPKPSMYISTRLIPESSSLSDSDQAE